MTNNIKTFELVELLTKSINEENQPMINVYAYELTTRLFVPNTGYTFEEILEGFGYKSLNEDRQISIDDYMRSKKHYVPRRGGLGEDD